MSDDAPPRHGPHFRPLLFISIVVMIDPGVAAGRPHSRPWSSLSEANRRDHWAARHRRAADQQELVLVALAGLPVPAGRVRVAFVRRGGRRMDGDYLAGAFKACPDLVAGWLAFDDGDDSRAAWHYRQRPGKGCPGCVVVVRPG